jgi:hypothetical protein
VAVAAGRWCQEVQLQVQVAEGTTSHHTTSSITRRPSPKRVHSSETALAPTRGRLRLASRLVHHLAPVVHVRAGNSEEFTRYGSLPVKFHGLYRGGQTKNRWQDRHVWKEDWADPARGDLRIGWKWRHESSSSESSSSESSSPEPEDLSGLKDLATFELDPVEAEALEAIPPSTPRPAALHQRRYKWHFR